MVFHVTTALDSVTSLIVTRESSSLSPLGIFHVSEHNTKHHTKYTRDSHHCHTQKVPLYSYIQNCRGCTRFNCVLWWDLLCPHLALQCHMSPVQPTNPGTHTLLHGHSHRHSQHHTPGHSFHHRSHHCILPTQWERWCSIFSSNIFLFILLTMAMMLPHSVFQVSTYNFQGWRQKPSFLPIWHSGGCQPSSHWRHAVVTVHPVSGSLHRVQLVSAVGHIYMCSEYKRTAHSKKQNELFSVTVWGNKL